MSEKQRVRNIADLARIAGVSPGTVSRALSGTGLISQATRDRIQELAKEHDFRPNVMARNLRIRRAGAIGVVAPLGHANGSSGSDPGWVMGALGRVADCLDAMGYSLLISRLRPGEDRQVLALAESGRVDAVVVLDGGKGAQGHSGSVPVVGWDGENVDGMVNALFARIGALPSG